jgi:hypothetical protein
MYAIIDVFSFRYFFIVLLQRETNQILGELVSEMRQTRSDLNSRLDQLINLKKLKLELLQEGIELKRKKLNIN